MKDIKDFDNIHIIIEEIGYGKTYRKIRNKLLSDRGRFIKSNKRLKESCEENNFALPLRYEMNKAVIDYIDYLIDYFGGRHETE